MIAEVNIQFKPSQVGAAAISIYAIIAWGIEFTHEVKSAGHGKLAHDVTYSDLYRDSEGISSSSRFKY